jgi:hypothetical protein
MRRDAQLVELFPRGYGEMTNRKLKVKELSIAKILSAYDFNRIRDCHSQAKRDTTRA